MSLSNFVSFSSILLFGWLAATYFLQVPAQSYPRMEKHRSSEMTRSASAEVVSDRVEGTSPSAMASPVFFSQ